MPTKENGRARKGTKQPDTDRRNRPFDRSVADREHVVAYAVAALWTAAIGFGGATACDRPNSTRTQTTAARTQSAPRLSEPLEYTVGQYYLRFSSRGFIVSGARNVFPMLMTRAYKQRLFTHCAVTGDLMVGLIKGWPKDGTMPHSSLGFGVLQLSNAQYSEFDSLQAAQLSLPELTAFDEKSLRDVRTKEGVEFLLAEMTASFASQPKAANQP